MKKLVYGSLFLALTGIGMIGCKKEIFQGRNNSPTNSDYNTKSGIGVAPLYHVSNGMLVISSVENFDSLINIADEQYYQQLINLSYTSYQETVTIDSLNSIEDQLLSAVLNSNRVVQIGNYIYRINKSTEKVFALHKSQYNVSFQDLIAENIGNKNVLEFSTEDNVFELLGEYKNEESDGEKALSKNCQSSQQNNNGGWYQYADFTDVNNIYGKGKNKRYKFSVWLRVRYDNWGIYRKLFTEFKHKEAWGGIWDETYASIAFQVHYIAKNGHTGVVTHYPTFAFASNPNYTATANYEFMTKNKEVVHYRQTKCLKSYALRSWVWYRDRATLKPKLWPSNGCLRITGGGLNSFPC